MSALVVGLYPTAPVDGGTFSNYLTGLTITAYQIDFNHPSSEPAPPHLLIGSATYAPPGGQIFQIETLDPTPLPHPVPAAAGVAFIDAASVVPAFTTPQSLVNVALNVKRGTATLVDHDPNYDVQLDGSSPPFGPVTSLGGLTVGLYLQLPDPAFDSLTSNTFLVPAPDGSPPPWTALDTAITAILAEDPGGAVDGASLSADDCQHIAWELVSNRGARPLPLPLSNGAPDLGALYTLPMAAASSTATADRQKFEGSLKGFYGQLMSDASRMAGFVAAWSAAKRCEQLSHAAANAAITLPVRLTSTAGPGQQAEATVVLGS